MTATDSGDSGALGRELQIAQEQQANPMPLSFTAYFWHGTRGSRQACFWTEAPWRPSAVSGVECTDAFPLPPRGPRAWYSFGTCMCCPLRGHWTLVLGLPCACLECLGEGLWAWYFTGSSFSGAEEAY